MAKHRSTACTPPEGGSALRRPGALLVAALGIGALSLLVGLLVLTLAPSVLGWRSDVVLSGSMSPALQPGDVVVSAPVGQVQVGDVVVVRNPARPGSTLVHRVDSVRADGTITTRGDANTTADSTPVLPNEVLGRGRLRVPDVGLASLWLQEGRWAPLGAVLIVAAGATWGTVTATSAATSAPGQGRRRAAARPAHRLTGPPRHRLS
jgi:signal peptidase